MGGERKEVEQLCFSGGKNKIVLARKKKTLGFINFYITPYSEEKIIFPLRKKGGRENAGY